MKVVFALDAWYDYTQWADDDPLILARINLLIAEAIRSPASASPSH